MNEVAQKSWSAALARAKAEGTVVYRVDAQTLGVGKLFSGVLTATKYRIHIHGQRPLDVTCTCEAGQHGRICKHRAVAVWARKYGVYAVAPAEHSTAVA